MTEACTTPLSFESLVDYFAGELAAADEDAVEQHLLACTRCAAQATAGASVTESLRASIPPVIGPERLQRLRHSGRRILDNPMRPGEVKTVAFPRAVDVLVQRLGGLDLTRTARLSLRLYAEQGGAAVLENEDAPFDRARGEVLVACQQHFASLPHDVVFEVRAFGNDGSEQSARYVVRHRYEAATGV